MTALIADVIGPEVLALGGVLAVAGIFATISIVWYGFWFLRPTRRKVDQPSDEPR
jgi:hypothetical protein